MKKKLSIVFLVLLMGIIAVSAIADSAYVYTKNGKNLNVRKDPYKDAQITDSIRFGTHVTVDYYPDSTWAHITYGSRSGYVMSRYLTSQNPGTYSGTTSTTGTSTTSSSSTSTVSGSTAVIAVSPYDAVIRPSRSTGRVIMRRKPDTKSDAVMYLRDGYKVHVTAESRYWAQVVDPDTGNTGYVYKEFIESLGSSTRNDYYNNVTNSTTTSADDHG